MILNKNFSMSKKASKISQKKDKIDLKNEEHFRLTKQRLAILKYLRKASRHPAADVIYKEVKKEFSRISFGTVYRNLKFLKEHGYIKEFIVNKISHFDWRVDSHVHMVCDSCNTIFDLDDDKLVDQLQRLAKRDKFVVRFENFEIRGYCKACQKKLLPKRHVPELFCMACGFLIDDLKKESALCKECKFQVDCTYAK